MFGILYLLATSVASGVNKFRDNIDNERAREDAKRRGDITYYGKNGLTLLSNDRSVRRKYINGDDVLTDLHSGKVYKNFSEEQRQKKERDAETRGNTVINVNYDENQEYNRAERFKAKTISITPDYRDIRTRRFYISVCLNGLVFYMDIISGELVRLKDGTDTSNKWGNLSVEEIMNVFNKRQRELAKIPESDHDFMWWEEHFYLKHTGFNTLFIDNDKNIIEGDYKYDPDIKRLRATLIERR